MPKNAIAEQLDRARQLLTAAADPELSDRLGEVGYGPSAIADGQALYNAAIAARGGTHAAHGDQLGSTLNVDALRDKVEEQVSALTQTARTVFSANPDALETLGLRLGGRATPQTTGGEAPAAPEAPPAAPRRRSRSQAALLDNARVLYAAALSDPTLAPMLQSVGYSRARLEAERADVAALEATDVTQEGRKATAKARTADQRAALEALNDWIERFRGIVKVALRDRPDLLDKLGL